MCGFAGCLLLAAASDGRCEGSKSGAGDVVFASAGVGGGSQGLAGVVSLNFSRGRLFYVLRMSRTEEFSIFGPSPIQSDTDYAVLVGRSSRSRRSVKSAAVGIGLVRSVRRGALIQEGFWFFGPQHERLDRVTVGLPIDLKATANVRGIGIGVNLFGNLNTKGSFAGVALTLQLGKLR